MTSAEQTASGAKAAEVAAKLRARCSLLVVRTGEEVRAEGHIFEGNAAANYETVFWDIAAGSTSLDGQPTDLCPATPSLPDPEPPLNKILSDAQATLKAVRDDRKPKGTKDKPDRQVWVLRDYLPYLTGPNASATLRLMRNVLNTIPKLDPYNARAVILIGATGELPPELQSQAQMIDWPLPDRDEIAELVEAAIAPHLKSVNGQPAKYTREDLLPETSKIAAINAALGLSGIEAQATFATSLVRNKKIDPLTISAEKKRLIDQVPGLELIVPTHKLDAVGGHDDLKEWCLKRALSFSPRARAFKLPTFKGALLSGVPGCGKSWLIQCLANELGIPLVKVDLGAMKGKFVGESEAKLRAAFKVIDTFGLVMLWFDELEKSLAGSAPGASADGGVSSDVLGFLLNWMQEHKGDAFIMATANDASVLPPELLRKGRFDEVWWIDFPTTVERRQVMAATLRKFDRDPESVDLDALAEATDTFTGAEIAALVPEALFTAFVDNERAIKTDDLMELIPFVVPLYKSRADDMAKLKEKIKARPSSSQRRDERVSFNRDAAPMVEI